MYGVLTVVAAAAAVPETRAFYADLAAEAPPGCLFLFLDVRGFSRPVLDAIRGAMAGALAGDGPGAVGGGEEAGGGGGGGAAAEAEGRPPPPASSATQRPSGRPQIVEIDLAGGGAAARRAGAGREGDPGPFNAEVMLLLKTSAEGVAAETEALPARAAAPARAAEG